MIVETISIKHNGLYLEFAITSEKQLKFLHFSSKPMDFKELKSSKPASDWGSGDLILEGWPLVQIQVPGYDRPYESHGNKPLVTAPGYALQYVLHTDETNETGRLLTFMQKDDETGLQVTTTMQFYGKLPIVRCKNLVENIGNATQTLEYVSSFFYQAIEKEGREETDLKMRLSIPHNSWMKEMNWKNYSFKDIGLQRSQPIDFLLRTSKSFALQNTGHWSTKEFLPIGCLENTDIENALFWQIEHNGSWNWEISDYNGHFCLGISGPDELHAHWSKDLKLGDSFETVPVAVGAVSTADAQVTAAHSLADEHPVKIDASDKADIAASTDVSATGMIDTSLLASREALSRSMAVLTQYRRLIRRPNKDNETLPVIFNDYMNCLFADPTTEKEIPLIEAAAEIGCEYYVIDAGWYSDGFWWDSVGEWRESKQRFPGGLRKLTDLIRSKGMIPGVWLELEVMGIHCPLVEKVPEEWFFHRHGKKIYDRSRYQLDFRHPGVVKHVSEVVRHVVEDLGVGYIKMDYNIEPGIGTEWMADSYGDGLMQHEKAYLAWLDSMFRKYPDLVIENCSSGGLRMDYAMLSRHSLQSTSDNEDYRMYATIAANAPSAVTPEQAAIWSYPRRTADKEETIFNMVNALFHRIHQSGHLAELSEENLSYVRQGIDWYKAHRQLWKNAVPYWPLGFSDFSDTWSCLAMHIHSKNNNDESSSLYEKDNNDESSYLDAKDNYDESSHLNAKQPNKNISFDTGMLTDNNPSEAYLAIWKRDDAEWKKLNGRTNSPDPECASSNASDAVNENTKQQKNSSHDTLKLHLPQYIGKDAQCAYPAGECEFTWDKATGSLSAVFPEECMARIFSFL